MKTVSAPTIIELIAELQLLVATSTVDPHGEWQVTMESDGALILDNTVRVLPYGNVYNAKHYSCS